MADTSHKQSGMRPVVLDSPEAVRLEMTRIGIDPAGIASMLPKLDHTPVLLKSVRSAAANILKQEMLSLGGDAAVARGTVSCSIESTDVLLIGNRKQLGHLSKKLQGQPFGLSTLAARLSELLKNTSANPQFWRTSKREIPLVRPLIMGILNITPDSFSDGGRYCTADQALSRAIQMAEEGADIIDIGGESTRPGAPQVTTEEEMLRILPLIGSLATRLSIPISTDTWKSTVAEEALNAGAEIINDISGLSFDNKLAGVIARHRCGAVLMHTRGTPKDMQSDTQYDDLMADISSGLESSASTALSAGIEKECIVVDPGIGFGKDWKGNLEILARLEELSGLGYPLLVGASRKSFIGKVTGQQLPEQRMFGTAATVALAIAKGAKILRVHDVKEMRDTALMADAIKNYNIPKSGDIA